MRTPVLDNIGDLPTVDVKMADRPRGVLEWILGEQAEERKADLEPDPGVYPNLRRNF
jgi:hypothetical protein